MRIQHVAWLGLSAAAVIVVGFLVVRLNDRSLEEQPKRLTLSRSEYSDTYPEIEDFFMLLDNNPAQSQLGMRNIANHWRPANAIMLVEILAFVLETPREPLIKDLLVEKLALPNGYDKDAVYKWGWDNTEQLHPDYAAFKTNLYGMLDPRFRDYFTPTNQPRIRLDEIRWGGVLQDGIPPLDQPTMVSASEANYLDDEDVVYGIEINEDARAYPERIISWHEMFKDTVGDVSVCGVYCTLCGSMILYETEVDGTPHEFGTSGFLYRSNKLMYDKATSSLWFTLSGEPVVGQLAGKGIRLKQRPVVKTTWRQWRDQHPESQVLSIDTGMDRRPDTGKIVRHYRHSPYIEYLESDELMFSVPLTDDRLKEKEQVLAIRSESPADQLAIHVEYLKKNRIHHDTLAGRPIVVITGEGGGSRIYESGGIRLVSHQENGTLVDADGETWTMTESALTGPGNQELKRLPAHQAFWFGWYNAFPDTRLIK